MAVRVLLLDFDGTLADSLPALRRVYERFVTSLGGQPSSDEFDALNGPPLRDVVQSLCLAHQGREMRTDDLDAYQALIAEQLALIEPRSGADALLEAARKRRIRCGIVTSGRADPVNAWLRSTGLAGKCDFVISSDDVQQGKPSPEPYAFALNRAGVRSDEALAIEDSAAGVFSATAAGIPTLRLTSDPGSGPQMACITCLNEAVPYLDGLQRQ